MDVTPGVPDRSQWWVALDGYGEPCVWRPGHGRGGPYWILRQGDMVDSDVWDYVAAGLPDRGSCEDCTAIPCPAHDPAGVIIPEDLS